MIKKALWLLVLGSVGYLGYLVWNNLDEPEKHAVKQKMEKVTDKTLDAAKSAADKLTGSTKDLIHDHLMQKDKKEANQPPKQEAQ